MKSNVNRYSYRLLKDTKRVFVITRRYKSDKDEILRRMIYTEPHRTKSDDTITNMIIGYCNKRICEEKLKNIKDLLCDDAININESNIMYMKGMSARLNMPMRVIANIYCDIETKEEYEEIYYYMCRRN